MLVKFWGTRGSLPTAIKATAVRRKVIAALMAANGRRFGIESEAAQFVDEELNFELKATYGGASSCVEIDGGNGGFLVCDMGSGLREFGIEAVERVATGHKNIYNIFSSHLHWDHIMGFPFFIPVFDPEATIRIFGGHDEIESALRRQQEKVSFPVPFEWLKARFEFKTLTPETSYEIGGYNIDIIRQYHDNDSYGYRFSCDGKAVVYSTDSEYKVDNMEREDDFVDFFRRADLVIMDTMYSLADSISMKEDWGHSSNVIAVDLCHRASASRLAMFHHEPIFDDETIRNIHLETIRYEQLMRQDMPLEVLCAYDGLEIKV